MKEKSISGGLKIVDNLKTLLENVKDTEDIVDIKDKLNLFRHDMEFLYKELDTSNMDEIDYPTIIKEFNKMAKINNVALEYDKELDVAANLKKLNYEVV